MRMCALFGAKNFGFEIYGVSARTREGQCEHFADKGGGSILCGRLLWTAPYSQSVTIFPADGTIKMYLYWKKRE